MLKLYPSWFMFLSLTSMGILLIVSSNNWFMAWMGFELSLMGFMPMFISDSLTIEGMVKYFLVQVGGSSLFILSYLTFMFSSISSVLFICSMFIKLGVFPFFQWVPAVMALLEWGGCLLMVTVQKLAPLFMIMLVNPMDNISLIMSVSALSALMASILGFNQTLLRLLLAYSSIIHTSWILIISLFSFKTTFMYLLVYYILTIFLFLSLSLVNSSSVVSTINASSTYASLSLSLLVLTGMPPFSVFFLKVMVISYMVSYPSIAILMLLSSCISTYFYMMFIIPSVSKYWSFNLKSWYTPSMGILLFIGLIMPFLFLF